MDIDISNDKLACFIHSTTLDLWKDVFLIELLDYMKTSGLLSKMNQVFVINTGMALDNKKIEELYAPTKVVYFSENTLDFENTTIRLLHVFSVMNPEYKLLYMHTKGISYTTNHIFYKGVKAWNKFMLYSLVGQYKHCLRMLKVYDTVGCNFRPEEHGNACHFSGNFWWATANYIKGLPIHYLKDKYDPEFWLLRNDPLFHNIHTIENMYEQEYLETNYRECVQRGLEDNVLYCKVGFPCTGLCNQLYNIANSITIAGTQVGNKVIILDDFLNDVDMEKMGKTTTTEVLDLPKMNENLQTQNIHLIYKNDVIMTLDKVEYGLKEVRTIDVTQIIKERFYKQNQLYIPQWTGLNDVVGHDPCPQLRKQVYVYYSLNGIAMLKVFHERKLIFNQAIEINHMHYDGKPPNYVMGNQDCWLTRINRDDSRELKEHFDMFLRTGFFFKPFYEREASRFLSVLQSIHADYANQKINILHVRNEPDAISHWSKLNNMSETEFKALYDAKYIDFVENNISKKDINIVLTSDIHHNTVIDELTREGYKVYARSKIEHIGREMNAVIDLIIGSHCTGLFLGNINPSNMQGSTFSYVLYNKLKTSAAKCYTINIDVIHENVSKMA